MLNCLLSNIRDGESFSRSCLAISEQSHHSFLEESGQKWLNLKLVDVIGCLLVSVGVIEHELVILDIFRDSVYFYFRLVHLDARIEATYCVDLALNYFFFEKRSFTHTDTNVHLVRADMI